MPFAPMNAAETWISPTSASVGGRFSAASSGDGCAIGRNSEPSRNSEYVAVLHAPLFESALF
eukprot:1376143-Alexandrium_andersonii.AAC.1